MLPCGLGQEVAFASMLKRQTAMGTGSPLPRWGIATAVIPDENTPTLEHLLHSSGAGRLARGAHPCTRADARFWSRRVNC